MIDGAAELSRPHAIARLARRIADEQLGHPVRVAIDGITASGKSTLARDLTAAIGERGRPVIHISMDGFHHPRARRHRQGRESAAGYYEDAYDFAALAEHLLKPLGPGGSRRYRTSVIDLHTDVATTAPLRTAPDDAVLIVDGTFLQRPEIRDMWDERIWIDTAPEIARRRGVERDADALGGKEAAERLFARRYHAASRLYIDSIAPAQCATVIFRNGHPSRVELKFVSPPA